MMFKAANCASLVIFAFVAFAADVNAEEESTCFSPVVCSDSRSSQTSWKQVSPTAGGCEKPFDGTALLEAVKTDFENKLRMMRETVDNLAKTVKQSQGKQMELNRTITLIGDKAEKDFLLIPKEKYCYMGMKDYSIPDSAINASSEVDNRHAARYARLDNPLVMTSANQFNNGAWTASRAMVGEWIQVDLGVPRFVGGIVTQGRPETPAGHKQWIRAFHLSYGNSTDSLSTIEISTVLGRTISMRPQVFQANQNTDGKVINMFEQPIYARYIRVLPQSWYVAMSMRMELIRGECHGLYPPGMSNIL